jgi:uncharacterized protein
MWGGGGQLSELPLVRVLQDMAQRLAVEMDVEVQKICSSAVLTIHGTADRVIPVEDAYSFERLISNHELFVLDGADHYYRGPAGAIATEKAVEFLTRRT